MPAGFVQVRVEAILHFLLDVWATTAPGGLIASPVHCARARLSVPGIGRQRGAGGGNGLWPIVHQWVGLPSSESVGQSCAG